MRIRILAYRLAFDVFHYEVGQPFGSSSTVQQPRNVRVIQVGENLALVSESTDDKMIVHPTPDQLDCNSPFELVVGSDRQVDRAHPAGPDFSNNLISAQPPSDYRTWRSDLFSRHEVSADRGGFNKVGGPGV